MIFLKEEGCIMKWQVIHFQQHGDERGQLISLEHEKEIPFHIKRVYFVFDTKKDVRRGYHAHKNLEQVLVCVNGECKIHVDDGCGQTEEIILNKPFEGLYISNDVWREMYDFSSGAVLMVLASELYNEKDYIREYSSFIEYLRRRSDEH